MTEGERIGRQRRYGLLLVTLIAMYLLSALASGWPSQAAQLVLVVAVTLIALRNTDFPHRALARWATVAGSVLAIVRGGVVAQPGRARRGQHLDRPPAAGDGGDHLDGVLRLDTVTAAEHLRGAERLSSHRADVRRLLRRHRRPRDRGDFFVNGEPANIRTYQYFSFTTLTTLGYGDFTAGGSFGRAVAVLEALTGQVFLATLVARLVSAYRGPARRDRAAR